MTLGHGVGGLFVPYEDNEEVMLAVAPQGGFGVSVLIQTQGLYAEDRAVIQAQLDTEIDGMTTGSFLLENHAIRCRTSDIGGEVVSVGTAFGIVVGFDPAIYATNDDLLALDGMSVELVVTVTDADERSAIGRQPVTIRVGG